MLKKNILIGIAGLFLTKICLAFTAGVDYQILNVNPIPASMLAHKHGATIKVVEFFSYACPWCFKLDPALALWEKSKPANVEFERVPVLFQPQWIMFSKVFYVASELKVEHKLHKAIFDTVQTSYPEDPSTSTPFSILKAADFSTDQGISDYFIKQGVKPAAVTAVLKDQTTLNDDIAKATALTKVFMIAEIPAVIVNGKYLISNRYTGGDNQKLIDTLNFVITLK